jgi:hypothetical protein
LQLVNCEDYYEEKKAVVVLSIFYVLSSFDSADKFGMKKRPRLAGNH